MEPLNRGLLFSQKKIILKVRSHKFNHFQIAFTTKINKLFDIMVVWCDTHLRAPFIVKEYSKMDQGMVALYGIQI